MFRSRLDSIQPYSTHPARVPAERYNLVRLALRRLENPIRLQLPRLRTLDLILEDDAWVIVDRSLNDIPIMAWTHFENRTSLHDPVCCTQRHYHAHAGVIMASAWKSMDSLLAERLAETHSQP